MKNIDKNETLNNADIACDLCRKKYSYEEILDILSSGTVIEKQPAILALEELKSSEDCEKLLHNLIGQDGRIREVTAFKVNELIEKYPQFFQSPKSLETLLKSVIDVNPTICRLIIDALKFVDDKAAIVKKLIDELKILAYELSLLPKNAGKYVLNKKYFKLYWLLEALSEVCLCSQTIFEKDSIIELTKILDDCSEYTIREKLHKLCSIAANLGCDEFAEFVKLFQNDENFYVRRNILSDNA